jgi:hypothetical protein
VSLIVKGTKIIFELADGSDVKPPPSYGMLHDPQGKAWPYRSLLIGPFRHGGKAPEDEVTTEARKYLGKGHTVKRGSASLPPRSGPWEKLGEVAVLYYYRGGTRARGGMRHVFGKMSVAKVLLGSGKAHLSRCGSWYRLNLPAKAVVDDRGLVFP